MNEMEAARRVRQIMAEVKPLAAEYYQLTGKPLGVTGEIAEYVAAEILGLELAPPRTPGYDAIHPGFPRLIAILLTFNVDFDIRINTLRRYWGLGHGVPDG